MLKRAKGKKEPNGERHKTQGLDMVIFSLILIIPDHPIKFANSLLKFKSFNTSERERDRNI